MTDNEIQVIRRVRHAISAEFGHDVDRVVDYYRSVEEELKQSGRYRFAAHAAGPEPTDAREAAVSSEMLVGSPAPSV